MSSPLSSPPGHLRHALRIRNSLIFTPPLIRKIKTALTIHHRLSSVTYLPSAALMNLQLFKMSLPPHKEKWEQDSDNQNDHEHNSAKHHIRQQIKYSYSKAYYPCRPPNKSGTTTNHSQRNHKTEGHKNWNNERFHHHTLPFPLMFTV